MSKNAQLFMNHTWICLLLLPSCIELIKSIGHKVKIFAIFNFYIFALPPVKINSAKYATFEEVVHRYLEACTVYGIWNVAGKRDASKSPVPTFCQLLPPERALGLTMDLKETSRGPNGLFQCYLITPLSP